MSPTYPEGAVYMKTANGEVRIGNVVAQKLAAGETEHLAEFRRAAIKMNINKADVQRIIDHFQNKDERRYHVIKTQGLPRRRSQAQPHKRDTNRKANKQARVARRRNRK